MVAHSLSLESRTTGHALPLAHEGKMHPLWTASIRCALCPAWCVVPGEGVVRRNLHTSGVIGSGTSPWLDRSWTMDRPLEVKANSPKGSGSASAS